MNKDLLLWLSFLILTLTGNLSFASGELDGKGLICKSDEEEDFFLSRYDGDLFVNGGVIRHFFLTNDGGEVTLDKLSGLREYETNETHITWGTVNKYCENPSSLTKKFSCWMDKPDDTYYLTFVDRRTLKKVTRSKICSKCEETVYTSQCDVAETETIYFQMLERRRLEHQQKIQRYLDSRKI